MTKKRNFTAFMIAIMIMLFSLPANAEGTVGYAQWDVDNRTLTFKGEESVPEGAYELNTGYNNPGWNVISIRESVTKVVFDESFKDVRPTSCYRWFRLFTLLTTIEGIENLNTEEVTVMSDMFNTCKGLENLDLSSFNTAKVEDMGYMFSGSYRLTSLDLSSFNTAKVTNMSCMFSGCYGLASLDLSSFNTAEVTDMSGMFGNCSALTSLDVSSFNTVKVTKMSAMFSDCSSLNKIYVSNYFATSEVISSDGMFYGCTNLIGNVPFDPNNIDHTMANYTSGYFTKSNLTPYVKWNADTKVLTFKVANYIEGTEGECEFNEGAIALEGVDLKNNCKKVVFTPSFKQVKPTSCYSWFDSFSNLTTIQGIENLNTEEVKNMMYMFYGCKKLTSLDLSSFNTAKVTNMNGMFGSCSSLTSLDVSSFNTDEVEEMSYMFGNCTGLKSLDLSSFNTAKVTDMGYMFGGCSGLTSLNLSSFNTAKVMYMMNMFVGCKGLTSLDLSSFNTANVEVMSYMFNGCSGLTTIYVSDDFTTNKVSESNDMFSSCSNLKGATSYNPGKTGIDMANFDGYFTPKIITPYVKWDANTKVLTFKVANTKEEGSGVYDLNEGATAPGWSISEVKNNCTNVVFTPSFNHAKPTSCYKWFYYFEKLKTIQGIENLYTDNVENMGYMFYYCSKLTSVDVSKFNTAKVTDMSNMFYYCLNLTSLDVSKFNTAKVTDMSHMFNTCLKLTSLDVSKFNTAKVTNMNYMFGGCEGLISLDLSSFNTAEVTDMSNMFKYCIGLPSLDLSSFNTAKVTDMSNMFYFCKSLTSLDLSSFNTANVTYMSYMFHTCLKLTSLDLSSFNTAKVTNMMSMFSDCPVLTSLDLSSFNTAKVTNMGYMFENCSGLTTIYVSDDFTISNVSSQSNLFDNCSKLKGAIAFNSDRKDKSMANYTTGYFSYGIKTVEDWNNFADKVNNGYTTMCAGLLKDITDANVLTTIGSNGFTGTFDGFGHTISGLNFNSTFSALYAQNGGTIKNLGILNATIAEGASGNICQTNSGTIESCYFMGTTTGSTQSAGGICPTNDGITKCYYLADEDNGNGGKTEEQFISGEVAYLLSQGTEGSVWGQQLGTDNNPVISEYKVIRSAKGANNTYWATFSNQNSDVTLSVPSARNLTVYNATVSNGKMTLSERTENQVAKGEGVLLKTDGEYVNAKANETNELTGETYANNNLVATPATEQTITAETGYTLYCLTYNNVSTKEGLGFYLGLVKNEDGKVDETSRGKKLKVTPGKAYLKVSTDAATDPSTSKLALGFAFPDNDDETVTGISGVTVSNRIQTSDRIYDLQGRPVVNPTKGVYIRNGRKVVY